ncbi:DUF4123 domain-containing protein [Kushneria aurantia]|uniref:DUF4123 domain-containing protein n=1 Tax=Kushneria aurantia TaxID=504092 RepID=A0ABV6G6I5_9GAMM|nr:DUF4123 domain-containing protein [Kushneria aurantia]
MSLIDHYSPGWLSETRAMLENLLAREPRPGLHFLLDASFRHETVLPLIRARWPEGRWCSLYQDTANVSERVLAVSPLLLAIDEESLDSLAALAEETSGRPMLSLVVSDESMASLYRRLGAFRIVTVRGMRYVLRLADTRRLPQIVEMLTESQRSLLMGHMTAWYHTGRDGSWHDVSIDVDAVTEPDSLTAMTGLALDERQARILIDMNRIDALIDSLRLHEPALYNAFTTPSQRYVWVEEMLSHATGSVETYPQQVECCRRAAVEQGWLV